MKDGEARFFQLPDLTETERPYIETAALSRYCETPTHLRVSREGGPIDLDGIDLVGNFTEACWSFDSEEEALDARLDFLRVNGLLLIIDEEPL